MDASTATPRTFFARHPVFTSDEFADHHRRTGSGYRVTRQSILAHHEARGRIVRLRRGLYATVPPGVDPERAPVDPYLVASRLTPDAVLAYHTALELHGYAHSVFAEFQYLTRTSSRPARVRSFAFRPVRVPKALGDDDRIGVRIVDRLGLDVRVRSDSSRSDALSPFVLQGRRQPESGVSHGQIARGAADDQGSNGEVLEVVPEGLEPPHDRTCSTPGRPAGPCSPNPRRHLHRPRPRHSQAAQRIA